MTTLFLVIVVIIETMILLIWAYKKNQTKFDGTIEVESVGDDGGKRFSLAFDDTDPYDLDKKEKVVFEVKRV